jgi:hypothetical protein
MREAMASGHGPKQEIPVGNEVHHSLFIHTEEKASGVQLPDRKKLNAQLFAPAGEPFLLSQAEEGVQCKGLACTVHSWSRDRDIETAELGKEMPYFLRGGDPAFLERACPGRWVDEAFGEPAENLEHAGDVRRKSCFHLDLLR